MNAITTINAAAPVCSAPVFSLKGKAKGTAARNEAYMSIAPLAFVETQSRDQTIANIKVALGAKPTDAEMLGARNEWVIGRIASRLADADFPAGTVKSIDKLDHARVLLLQYAAPPKDGVKANKLRAGQIGRRSIAQHKAIRAAEEAWSQIKAELGAGTAQTQAQRNAAKAKRAPSMAGSGKGIKATPPTHSELIKPDGIKTADDACAYLEGMASTLLMFINKHAKVIPSDYGTMVKSFKGNIDAAAKARREQKA